MRDTHLKRPAGSDLDFYFKHSPSITQFSHNSPLDQTVFVSKGLHSSAPLTVKNLASLPWSFSPLIINTYLYQKTALHPTAIRIIVIQHLLVIALSMCASFFFIKSLVSRHWILGWKSCRKAEDKVNEELMNNDGYYYYATTTTHPLHNYIPFHPSSLGQSRMLSFNAAAVNCEIIWGGRQL